MNKKITTLLASALLTSAFSVGAQNKGDAVLLQTNSKFVSVQTGEKFGVLAASTENPNNSLKALNQATWTVSEKKTVLGETVYSFVNKATGLTLAVDPSIAIKNGASIANAPALSIGGGSASEWVLSEGKFMSFFTGDSVVYIDATGDEPILMKGKKADATAMTVSSSNFKTDMILTAEDLNTLLQSVDGGKMFNLSMTPNVTKGQDNLLTATALIAAPANTPNYVTLQAKDKKVGKEDAYVVVDTAYYDGTETSKMLKYTYDKLNADHRNQGSYQYQFIFNAKKQELYIKVLNVSYQFTQGTKTDAEWKDWLKANNNSTWSDQGTADTQETEADMYIYMARLAGTNVLTVNTVKTNKAEDGVTDLAQDKVQRTVVKIGTDFTNLTPVTIADGVYTIQRVATGGEAFKLNEAYALANLAGEFGWADEAVRQDFDHMPAAQWVVKKNGTSATASVSITNREFSDLAHSTVIADNKAIQFFAVAGSKDVFYYNGSAADTLRFNKVADELVKDAKLGYKYVTENDAKVQTFTFNYLHGLALDKYLVVEENGVVRVDEKDGKSSFRLEIAVANDKYGYDNALVRNVYYVTDGSKYLTYDVNSKKYKMGAEKTPFFLKENNCVDGKHYYALVEASIDEFPTTDGKKYWAVTDQAIYKGDVLVKKYKSNEYALLKVSVDDNTLDLTQGNLKDKFEYGEKQEIRTSAFAVETDDSPLYRRFNNENLGEKEGTISLMFREKTRGEYLMDEWNEKLQDKTVDYAGIWNKDKAEGKLAFTVDTAWVKRGLGYIKPQYLISVARNDQKGTETIPCNDDKDKHYYTDENGDVHPTDDPYKCDHAIKGHDGFRYGKYLVSFGDSAIANELNVPYMDVKEGYTRVGFVEAIHYGDSLIILTGKYEKADPAKLSVEEIIAAYKKAKTENLIVNLKGDNHKNVTWSFRYVTPSNDAVTTAEEGAANEFLFESNIYEENGDQTLNTVEDKDGNVISAQGKATYGFSEAVKGSIAPAHAAWLKMQNGCLVLTRGDSKFEAAKTGSDGALIFNAYQKTEEDDMVTSNDEIAAEGIAIVASNGTVTIQGAAGKSVVITNILGKVIAETVLTSDNATIAVPAGIVAVAVDGEEAVKAIVK